MRNYQSIVSKTIKTAGLLLAAIVLCGNMLFATVTVTAATGGTNISADKAANAVTPLFTTLGNIVITEGAKGDFAIGTGVTMILSAPSGWQFNTGASVTTTVTGGSGGQNVTVTNVAVASTTITLTMTVAATNKTDILTIIGIEVQATDGANVPNAQSIFKTGGTATITGITNSVTNLGSLSQAVGAMSRLIITLPGQSFTDGTTMAGSGNSGVVTSQTAGSSFTISAITATDQFYNKITTYSGAKTLAYSGPGGSASTYTTSANFTAGVSTTTLSTTLTRAQSTTLTVTDASLYGFASSLMTVNAAAFTKMQLIVPGETVDAGSATGKSGTPTARTAGVGFTVTVNAVDAYWNLINTTNTVSITTTDANDTEPSNAALVTGTKNFTVTLPTAGSGTITATNFSDGSKTLNTSPSITVNPDVFSKLQILAPGESAAPGTASGKTGSPSTRTAGSLFNVTVNAVDANWNLVSSVSDIVGITSSDPNASLPSNAALSGGTQTYSITLRTAGTATVTASDVSDPGKSSNTTPSLTVNAGAFSKLQILVPGETASPGTVTGKTGTPTDQTAAIPFNVTVNAVDADWNLVNSVSDVVGITSTDGGATLPANAVLSGGTGIRSVTFSTNGSFTVTATDITDGGKTPNTSPSITSNPAGSGTVTPATGGSAISADNVAGSYTPLTGPLYEEGQQGNVAVGTIILNAPSGFEFDAGGTAPTLLITRTGGSGDDTRNINNVTSGTSIAATSVTTSQITFTITNASNNSVTNSITWQNIRVRPTAGYPLASANITKSGSAVIAGVNGSTNFGTLTETFGAVDRLVVTFPGETFTAGSGNSGTVIAQTAGSSFNISSITATDQYLNVVTSFTGAKTLAYTGPTGATSSYTTSVSFTSGISTTPLATTLTRAEATTITVTESGFYGYASSSLTVNAGTFTKMQLIVPGETVNAGSATGKTGTPSARTAGSAFSVTVNAVDDNWNIVAGAPANTITLTTTDVNATMPAPAALSSGTVTFAATTLPTAGTATITATNTSDGLKTADTSPSITINPGTINKLQILVPGEAAAPGTISGKTGTPTNQASGSPLTVTVNAVDANWNLVSSTDVVAISSSDGAASLPANAALVAGTNNYNVTLNTAGAQTVTATDVTNGGITANTSPAITVASVVITAATGGSAISADNFGTGVWTSLTGPAYDEAASGDVGTGTFILNAPTGFIFDVGGTAPTVLITRIGGGGGDARNINGAGTGTSAAITSITTTQITFTISSASNGGVTNSVTWQNVRVRPTAGAPLASGNLTKTGTSVMTGIIASVTNFGTLTEVAGTMTRLVATFPGETFTSGSGNSGTPTAQTAGSSFNITSITATDQYLNTVTSYAGAKTLAYSDPGGSASTYTTSVNFTAGVSITTLATTLTRAENTTITVTDALQFGNVSSSITVNAAVFSKMQLIVPGETADAGSSTGKTGSPTARTAGTGFTVTANAVDAYWNIVSSTNTVSITTSDANDTHPLNAALVAGTKDFTVTFKTAGTSTATVTNVTDGTKTADTSPSITVNAGAFTKLQILAPGETADPGSVTGKTGSPSVRTAGSSFNVTVNAVDANWNLVNTVTDEVAITSSDANATMPANNTLSSGTQTFAITLRTGGTSTVTASDISDPGKTSNTTPSLTVNAGAFSKLQILMPGETANPGSATGKAGTPDVQTAGILFNVTVNAVDADWNLVTTITDVVGLSSSDGSATLSGNATLSGGTGIRNVTFSTDGSFTVTATDITDGGKTPNTSPSITVNPAGSGTVTPASGGSSISADGFGGSYTSLTGPVYEEGQNGNITAGTIILNVASGFIFDLGGTAPTLLITRTGGSGDDTRNINSVTSGTAIAADNVTTTQITFTITNGSNNLVTNSITWQNVRVRPTAGYPLASANMTVSGSATIAGVNGSTNFGTLSETFGAVARLVVTFPGQSFIAGSGNSGSVTNQTAGSPFTISSITATDQFLNIVTSYSSAKTLAYTGPAGAASSYTTSVSFTSGISTTSLATTLTRAEATTLTVTESGLYGYSSSSITVNAAAFSKMQLIVPGETANAGSVTGKSGSSSSQTAGTPFSVTVNAVDANWNVVSGAPNNTITLTTSDANAAMPAPAALASGTVTFAAVILPTAGTSTITATNTSDGTKTADTSPSITINPGAINKLQILVPGETAAPGTATGKTGTPTNEASGSPFTVTVNAVDANWNLVSSTDIIQITSTDGAAGLPSNAALVAGTKDFTVTLNTAGTQTVTATDVTNGGITANTSPSITVAAVVITAAAGGSAVSADDFGTGAWTSLTGPAYDEAASGDIGVGTFILNAPSGFIFDVGGTTPTVLMTKLTGGGGDTRNINQVATGTSMAISSITTTQITFTISSASNSGTTCRLTWQNIRIRPSAGTPLAAGNLTKTGTSTMTGITASVTNFGTLTEVFGALNKLVVTLPGQSFTSGSGNSGTPNDQVENSPFNISSITATDQYLNTRTSYSGAKTLSYSGPTGSPTYTTSVNFTSGVSTTTLTTTLTAIENITITANDGSVSGPASTAFNVNGAPKTWDGGGGDNNWNTGTNWSPDGVPTTSHDVTLNSANTINIDVDANTKNLTISNAGVVLTIQSGFSLSVNGNFTLSNGTVNTVTTFPSVSGTVSMSGGTIGYTAGGVQNISAQTYFNLTIGGSGTKTALGIITINGDLSIGSGTTLNDAGFQIVGNAGGTVTMAGSSALILGSAATATAFPSDFIIGNVSLNSASIVTYASDQPQNIDVLNFGNLSSSGAGNRTLPVAQTIGISGTFTPGTNSYTITSSTIDYNSTGSQTVANFTYNNLTISGGGTTTLSANTSVEGNLSISGGTLDIETYTADRSTSGGTLTIAAACTLRIGGSGTIPANYTTHTFSSTSIIDFYGTSPTIPAGTYENVNVSDSGTTLTLGGNVIINNTIIVSSGTLDLSTYTANRATSGGSLTLGSGATLRVGGTNSMPTNYSSYSLDPASTVEYYGTSHTITAVQYGNLDVTSSGAITLQSSGTVGVAGVFSVGSGTYTTTGSTVDFNNATGGQSIPAINYNNLTISNTSGVNTLIGTIGIGNAFTPSAGALTSAGTSTINFNNASGGQSIPAFDYYNLTINNTSGVNTLSGTINVSNTFTPSAGALTSAGTSTMNFNGSSAQSIPAMTYYNLSLSGAADTSAANAKTAAGTIIVSNILTINSNNTLEMGAYSSSTFGGSSVNSGKIKWATSNAYVPGTGVTEFYGSVATTVAPGTNYGNMLFTGSGTITISGAVTATGGVALVGVTVSNNLTISGTGVLTVTGMDLNNDGIISNNGTINVP
ncbi:MAG: hypothetical protein WCW35_12350 [Bacteroidota bacterium]